MTQYKSQGDRTFIAINGTVLILICISTLYPFLYMLSTSFSPSTAAFSSLGIIPKAVSLQNYQTIFQAKYIYTGFTQTLLRTLLGTGLSLVCMICTAYPLSKRDFPHRNLFTGLIVFTMFFSGGLIPSYLLVKNLYLQNTIWALILPGLISTYDMIIMRNFFMSLPGELEESAKIDGANDIIILFWLVIPLSMPIIATIILWQAVGHWNAWFDSLIYISKTEKQVLQVILRRIVMDGTQQVLDMNSSMVDSQAANPEGIKAAATMVVSLPIIAVYPFLQKYFVKGIMVGSLKG